MVQTVVLYKKPADPAAFDKYYFETHIPIVNKVPGIIRAEVSRFTGSSTNTEPPYYLIANLYFNSQEEMMTAFGTPEGRAMSKDVRNFAKPDEVIVSFAEVQ